MNQYFNDKSSILCTLTLACRNQVYESTTPSYVAETSENIQESVNKGLQWALDRLSKRKLCYNASVIFSNMPDNSCEIGGLLSSEA